MFCVGVRLLQKRIIYANVGPEICVCFTLDTFCFTCLEILSFVMSRWVICHVHHLDNPLNTYLWSFVTNKQCCDKTEFVLANLLMIFVLLYGQESPLPIRKFEDSFLYLPSYLDQRSGLSSSQAASFTTYLTIQR